MRRILAVVVVLMAALVLARGVVEAADPQIEEQHIEAPSKLTVGDHLRFIVKLTADVGTNVTLAPGAIADPFALAGKPSISSEDAGKGRIEVTVSLDLAAFAPGDLTLPPLKLAYKGLSGAAGVLQTQPATVHVESVIAADDPAASPRDLKPQADVENPGSSLLPEAIAVVVLALAAIAFAVWRRRSRRRRAVAPAEAEEEPEAVAEDVARGLLDRAGADFAADADYVAYYSVIAGTLRDYLTQRFGFPAFALTTAELQEQMVQRGMDRWQARIVGGLLSQCDAVVYARYRPATERADADLTAAYEIVEMSRPQPAPAPEPEPEGALV